MSARGATALRALAFAFGASALLVVLQTLVFQLLPYDSSATERVSLALGVGFWLADVALLVAFVALRRADSARRGLATIGAALAALSVSSGLAGLAAGAFASKATTLHALARTFGAAEGVLSMGSALLATLAVGALARSGGVKESSRPSIVTIVVSLSVALSLTLHGARLGASGPWSLVLAWTSWSVAVTRLALVAWLARWAARLLTRAPTRAPAREGPYRATLEGLAAPARSEPLDAATTQSLRAAASALSFYRAAIVARVAATVATTSLAVLLIMGSAQGDAAVLLIGMMPLASFATGVLVAIGLFKLLALAREVRARGAAIGAIVAIGLAILLDSGFAVLLFKEPLGVYRHRAAYELAGTAGLGWPLVALASGVSLLLAARALGRVGATLRSDGVVARACWVEACGIGAGTLTLAIVAAAFAVQASLHSSYGPPGLLVVLFLSLAAVAATLTTVVVHVLLIGEARAAILARVENAARAG